VQSTHKYSNKGYSKMAIIETKISTRASTDIEFYSDSGLPAVQAALAGVAGTSFVRTISSDQLVETVTTTHADLTAFSATDTNRSLALDAEFVTYMNENSFVTEHAKYTLTGIDQPFANTITYTLPAGSAASLSEAIVAAVETKSNLVSVEVHETSVVATLRFDDAEDFTTNFFNDLKHANEWHSAGVTRAISYSLI
jgi:hypothetical protein